MAARQPAKRHTVRVDGDPVVIAAFLYGDDAALFVRAANDAGLFAITHPGKEARAYLPDGSLNEPAAYKPD